MRSHLLRIATVFPESRSTEYTRVLDLSGFWGPCSQMVSESPHKRKLNDRSTGSISTLDQRLHDRPTVRKPGKGLASVIALQWDLSRCVADYRHPGLCLKRDCMQE